MSEPRDSGLPPRSTPRCTGLISCKAASHRFECEARKAAGSLCAPLRPKKAGQLRYLSFGKSRLWFYLEWGDGVKLWLGPLRASWKLRLRWKF